MMKEDNRAAMTGALWFFSAIVLVALFISAAAQGELTPGHMIFASILLGLAVIGTPILLRWKDSSDEQDKMKRERIDKLLRDLSEDDLIELKHRLADVESREETAFDLLGDDGELIRHR